MRNIFILVPAPVPTGPVKGAIALANELVKKRSVTFVTLKPGPGHSAWIDPEINQVSLHNGKKTPFLHWVREYRKLLRTAGHHSDVVSISMCFSADMVNLFCSHSAILCSSVRGNLLTNYMLDYGYPGGLLATAHLFLLRKFDSIVTMSSEMARQVERFTNKRTVVIGNFIDEPMLEKYRKTSIGNASFRFVFLGSLTKRKQPFLLIDSFYKAIDTGMEAQLDILGYGPLMGSLREHTAKLGIKNRVRFHGHLSDPYGILADADVLVLPSMSEGISRAAMEALYLGVPCVQRNVDGNRALIRNGYNGMLFSRDDLLSQAMIDTAKLSRSMSHRKNLLPDQFRQKIGTRKFLELVEGKLIQ